MAEMTRDEMIEKLELALNEALLGRGITLSQTQRNYRLNAPNAMRLHALRDACFDALGVLAALRAPAVTGEVDSHEQLWEALLLLGETVFDIRRMADAVDRGVATRESCRAFADRVSAARAAIARSAAHPTAGAPPALSVEDAHAAKSITPAPPAVAGGDAPECPECDGDGYTEVGPIGDNYTVYQETCKACRGTGRRRQEGQ